MLAAFQQAQGDLVASPGLCEAVRRGLEPLAAYDLDDRERRRLVAMAHHRGMEAACTLYRANRLAPLVLNLPALCEAAKPVLRELVDGFWGEVPRSDGHFLREADRFRRHVAARLAAGELPEALRPAVASALDGEGSVLAARLASEG